MKILALYRPNSEHSRTVEDYIQELQRRAYGVRFEALNVDSREGIATAGLYDIMEYPAILVMTDDGQLQKSWSGAMPMFDEVLGYARA